MNVPEAIRMETRDRLWTLADAIGWMHQSGRAKTMLYDSWERDPQIGGVLGRFMTNGQVRMYIKDSLLKDYAHDRLADQSKVFRILALAPDTQIREVFQKPHGRRLSDGKVICWGRAEDWKMVLMAMHERSFLAPNAAPFAAILMFPAGRFANDDVRKMVGDAAKKLGIEKLVWTDH